MTDDSRQSLRHLIDIALTADLPQEFLREIRKMLGCSICFRDANGDSYVESDDPSFCEHARSYPLEELRTHYSAIKLLEGERLLGHLIVSCSNVTKKCELLDSITLSIRVYHARRRAEMERRRSVESDTVQNFLTGKMTLEKTADAFKGRHFPLENGSMVAVIGYKNGKYEDAMKETEGLNEIDEKFRRFFKLYVTWYDRRKIIVAFTPQFPMNESSARDFIIYTLENIKRRSDTKEMFSNLCAGFGSVKENTEDLPKSYEEADMAFRAACFMNNDDEWWHSWHSLGALRLIMLFSGHPETEKFVEMVLGKLITEAPAHEYAELLETLTQIEHNSWNLKQTAQSMNFHYNTLKYRYMRLQEILGMDLSQSENRFNVSLALKLHSLRSR